MPSPEQGYTPPQESALSPEKQAEILAEIETIIAEKKETYEKFADQMNRDREGFKERFPIEKLANFFGTDNPDQFLAPEIMDTFKQEELFKFIQQHNRDRAQASRAKEDLSRLEEVRAALAGSDYSRLVSIRDGLRSRMEPEDRMARIVAPYDSAKKVYDLLKNI